MLACNREQMNNTLKDLDKVLIFIIKQDKKGMETYLEEVADLLKPQDDKYVDEILKRLTGLGYVQRNKETYNYKPSLDGMVFYENSEGMPFQEKGSLGSDHDLLNLVKEQKSKPYLFFFLMLFLFAAFVFYKMRTTQKQLEKLETVNIETIRMIDSLVIENARLNEDLIKKSLKFKKDISWSTLRINKLKAEVDLLSKQVALSSEYNRI